jgi:deferrochelatase/peroxidase EfeB
MKQLKISNRHRILRVGRNYDAQPGLHRPGLFFMCVNADIERQFEFVQQTWNLAPSFHGLEAEVDCFSGRGDTSEMTVPTPSGPLCIQRLQDFVTVLGGGYFFMPGRRTVRYLAAAGRPGIAAAAPERIQ